MYGSFVSCANEASAESISSFPIGVWLQSPIRERNGRLNVDNYKDIGVNTFVGLWRWPDESWAYPGYSIAVAKALKGKGMQVYAGSDQAAVAWNLANPGLAFAGYMLGDEADMNKTSGDPAIAAASNPDAWQKVGDAMASADPGRLRYANFGKGFALDPWPGYHIGPGSTKLEDFAKYVGPTTVISSDYYAIIDPYEALNRHGIWAYGAAVENTRKFALSRPVWGFVEASAAFSDSNYPAGSRNYISRRMLPQYIYPAVWAMIVHGARGIIYFCHDFSNNGMIEDGCLAEPKMAEAMKAANTSVQKYADVLLSMESVELQVRVESASPVQVLVRRYRGSTYVFAMGDGSATSLGGRATDANIIVQGGGAQSVSVSLPEESRKLVMSDGKMADHFEPYQLHIYKF